MTLLNRRLLPLLVCGLMLTACAGARVTAGGNERATPGANLTEGQSQ